MPKPYVLLDRDGVINYDSDDYIKSKDEWNPIPGSLEAIALLNKHDYKVAVITNQSGLGRGFFTQTALAEIHQKMRQLAQAKGGKIEHIYYCPHTPEYNCACRKPKPGLLNDFARDNHITLSTVYFIGDKLADIQAAEVVGAHPILVKTGQGQMTLQNNPHITHPIVKNLYDAAQFITSQNP